MTDFRLETERLVLRSWREDDLDAFAAICADPEVMATLGPVMDRDETAALIANVAAREDAWGHTFWALERREDQRLIGWCGVIRGYAGPVADKAEIGWRMARDCWGQGYISEAARATVDWVFAHCDDDSVWAITDVENRRSRAVMERLGMHYRPELDFDHPDLAEDDPQRRHVAYELPRREWIAR